MKSSILHWSIINSMNQFIYNLCVSEYCTNILKENVPPLLYVPYPNIYHIVVPKLIIYANISHFVILFFDVVHAYVYHFSAFPVSTLKHSFSFMTHFNSSETILMQWTGLVSYTLAPISLVFFESSFRTCSLCCYPGLNL